jgi:hypothetical protein
MKMSKAITKNRWDKLRQRMVAYGIEDVPLTELPANLSELAKDPEEGAERLLILLSISLCASNDDLNDKVADWLKTEDLWQVASDNEKMFLRSEDAPDTVRARLSFRFEGSYMLAWALGFVNEQPDPSGECDEVMVSEFFSAVPPLFAETDDFLASASFRRMTVLHDEYLFYQMCHLYFLHIHAADKENSSGVMEAVAHERYLALEWLFNMDQPGWDELEDEDDE